MFNFHLPLHLVAPVLGKLFLQIIPPPFAVMAVERCTHFIDKSLSVEQSRVALAALSQFFGPGLSINDG